MNKRLIAIALIMESIILINPLSVHAEEKLNKEKIDVINANKTQSESLKDDSNNEVKVGWKKDKDGNTILLDGKGNIVKSSWCEVGGQWYYFDDNGIMKTACWIKYEENWYHLNERGVLETGWVKDKESWYYLNSNGKMEIGWININDKWYYFNQDGVMQFNTEVDGYYLSNNGAMI